MPGAGKARRMQGKEMSYNAFSFYRARKHYQLSNHLGNVLSVISDRKMQHCDEDTVTYYMADVIEATDYSPFGAPMPERTWVANGTVKGRFGFNGKEMDNEVAGDGNQYDYAFRIYDPRVARFLSVDPLTKSYPMMTPYQFAANMPIWAIDLDGLEAVIVSDKNKTVTLVVNIYYVTSGKGKVNVTELKIQVNEDIVNQLTANQSTIMMGDREYTIILKVNHITVDEKGNDLTYEKAKEMAKRSEVEYINEKGEKRILKGYQMGAVVVQDNVDETHRTNFDGEPDMDAKLTRNVNDGDGMPYNEIVVRYGETMGSGRHTAKSFSHEMGHLLGLMGHPISGMPGITAGFDKDIVLTIEDLLPMFTGATQYGVKVRGSIADSKNEGGKL